MTPHRSRLRLIGCLVALLLAVAATMATARADAKCGKRCLERVARKQCKQHRPVPCLRRAGLRWQVSTAMLVRKARCESGLNPFARNPSGAAGLMQFLPSTFATTPYASRSIYSAKWNALAGGWMHAVGRGGEWVCR